MTEHCTPGEKKHMIDLIIEMQNIVQQLPNKGKIPEDQRKATATRIKEIGDEMKAFRKRYPLD